MSCKLGLAKLKTWTQNHYEKWGTRKTRGKAKYSDLTPEYRECSKNMLQLLFSVSIFCDRSFPGVLKISTLKIKVNTVMS